MPELALRFSHHIIEHLGLKLYQNRPTNVIAELVSNGWDAEADEVWVNLNTQLDAGAQRFVAVGDTGTGMSLSEIADNYLVIGKPKDRTGAREKARYPTGRKGIGKLAPFGIAHHVDLITVSNSEGELRANWISLNLPGILLEGDKAGPTETASYPPEVHVENAPIDDLLQRPDVTGQVAAFVDKLRSTGGTGTLVLLTDLSLLRAINADQLRQAMGRRFTVTLNRPDFKVWVDGKPIEQGDALPDFEFRIPPEGMIEDQIGQNKVKYWVGFVKTAAWPADESGVGVYAHGKIAQDRPFTFGVKGREIFTRYMYAVVEADFLDELDEDVISTDRRSIDWDHPTAASVFDWGQKSVRRWIEDYRASRRTSERKTVRKRIDDRIGSGDLPKIREDEKDVIAELLAEVTPSLGKEEGAADKLTDAVIRAYLHRPTREILKKVWRQYADGGDPAPFLDFADKLAAAAIPEALSLAVTFAQRAYALSTLFDMKHHGREPDLQALLERFPWILQPEMEKLTANQHLKTMTEAAWQKGLTPSRTTPGHMDINDQFKPDFVFFSDVDYDHIVVVEIKTPREDLNFKNREQLATYMTYVEQQYPDAKRKGYLVGSNSQNMAPGRTDVEILSWTDVFVNSRRGHIDMLAAMLSTANPDADDDRMKQILEFGGEEVWQLLERVSANDETLADLVASRPKI